jgi:hypothetical protein
MDMSGYTQAQLDALREAAASGVRTVTVEGKTITYASVGEILRLIAIMERSLTAVDSRVTYYNPVFTKGV